jgi:hypothetical protein
MWIQFQFVLIAGVILSVCVASQSLAGNDPPTSEVKAKMQLLEDQYLENIKATLPGNRGYRQLHANDSKSPGERLIETEYFKNKDKAFLKAESEALTRMLKDKVWRGAPSDPAVAPPEWSPMLELLSADTIRKIAEFMEPEAIWNWALSSQTVAKVLGRRPDLLQRAAPFFTEKALEAAEAGDLRTI